MPPRPAWSAVYLIGLALASLSPLALAKASVFRFAAPEPLDLLLNLVMYLPFGVMLRHRAPLATALLSGAFSLALELAQTRMFRSPSLWDLALNILGAVAGHRLSAGLRGSRAARPWPEATKRAGVIFGFLALAAALELSVRGLRPVTFSNWEAFPLVIGNEATIDRPFQGTIHEIAIYDRALPGPAEASPRAPAGAEPTGWTEGGPVLRLRFEAPTSAVVDGPEGATSFDPAPPSHSGLTLSARGLETGSGRWVLPEAIAERVRARLVASNALSVVAVVTPVPEGRGGQGRIVSMSLDFEQRNFTLGVKGTELHWRVRTETTGPNGDRPQVMTRGAGLGDRRVRLLVTFDGYRSRSFVDERFQGEVLLAPARPSGGNELLGMAIAPTLFAFVVLAALGAAWCWRRAPRRAALIGTVAAWGALSVRGVYDHYDGFAPRATGIAVAAFVAVLPLLPTSRRTPTAVADGASGLPRSVPE